MKTRTKRPTSAGIAAAAALFLALAACSSTRTPAAATGSTTHGASPTTSGVQLPGSFNGKQLVIPQQVGVAPYGYLDASNNLVGFDPDLSTALGTAIGHPIQNVQATFENGLLGLRRGVYLSVPGADVTPERLKSFDFAIALRDSYGFQVLASSPDIPNSMDGLCGLRIGAVAASSELPLLTAQSTKCTSAGKRALTIHTFADQPTVQLALQSKQIDAETNASSVQGYQQTVTPGRVKITGPRYSFVDIGFATVKGNGIAQVIADGLNKMIADGSYSRILGKYGATALAVTKATVTSGS